MMPFMRDDLKLDYTQVGFVVSAFAITSGISQLPGDGSPTASALAQWYCSAFPGVALAGLLVGCRTAMAWCLRFSLVAALFGGGYHPAAAAAIAAVVPLESGGSPWDSTSSAAAPLCGLCH